VAADFEDHELMAARQLHRQGVELCDVGRLSEAREVFGRALGVLHVDGRGKPLAGAAESPSQADRIARDEIAARILVSLALPTSQEHLEAGLAVLADADAIAGRVRLPGVTALICCQRGLLLLRTGRPAEALVELDAAVHLVSHAAPAEQFKIMMNRGDTHHLLGNVRAARQDFAAALAIARAAKLTEFEFGATHNLGFMAYLEGDLPRALSLMPTPAQASSDYARGVVGLDRAKVLLAAGLFAEADETLRQAAEAFGRTDLVQLLGEAQLARAEAALRTHSPGLARSLSGVAAETFERSGNARLMALARLAQLQAEIEEQLEPADVAARTAELATELEAQRLTDQSRVARLLGIQAALQLGKPGRDAAISVRAGEPISVRLQVRLVQARTAFERGDPSRARRRIRTGMAELARYQASFGSFDLQASSAAHGVELAALAVGEAIRADRPAEVLGWLERARTIAGQVPAVRPPEDSMAADLLTQLRWLVSQLEAEDTNPAEREQLRRRRQQLERDIRAHSWTQPGLGDSGRPPSMTTIRAGLGDAAMVVILWLGRQIHGVLVTASSCRLHPLGDLATAEEIARRMSADLDVLALERVPASLRRSAHQSLAHGLEVLDRLLLAPLQLPDAPVVLLPPGRLATVPWGELPSFKGRPVAVAPSAGTWLGARARTSADRQRVVAVAGPGLDRAEDEVSAVARSWPGCEKLTGATATGEAVLAAIDGARIVHIAAHGQHQRDSPLFSSIRLADGPVVGYDLDRVPAPPQQAVLSACDLGQATYRPGDEALGLTRALLHSGTSTVVSGVAKVSDRAAADLMDSYHHRLAAGSAPAYALADALTAVDGPQPFLCFGAGW
jgi:CHAT domain-containing protein/tetratricopeptide (TPR) repeat protein